MNRLSCKSTLDFARITKTFNTISKLSASVKPLRSRLPSKGGRVSGHIIALCRGNLHRRVYRYLDLKRLLLPDQKGILLRTVYSANHSGILGLICYPIGLFTYILNPTKIFLGDYVVNMTSASIFYGDSSSIAHFSSGSLLYNIAGRFTRSAGCSTILVRKDFDQALLKLKSGELRYFNTSVVASSGTVSNENHFLCDYKKAGRIRHLGFRPRTRPSSMNPVDHPMGGRTRGGCQPMNRKGVITLNRPTVSKHHPSILYTKRQLKLLRR
jgi:large subunit ribosomal protein L2